LCDWGVVRVVVEREEVELSHEARGVVLDRFEDLLLPHIIRSIAGVSGCRSAGVE